MSEWRGTIIQLALIVSLTLMVVKAGDPNILHAGVAIVGTAIGTAVMRAKAEAASSPPGGGGKSSTGTSLPPLVSGLAIGLFALVALVFFSSVAGCTPSQSALVKSVGVTIAGDVCKELELQPEPEWVLLLCTAEQLGGELVEAGVLGTTSSSAPASVRVRIPRTQWNAIRARTSPASPGK